MGLESRSRFFPGPRESFFTSPRRTKPNILAFKHVTTPSPTHSSPCFPGDLSVVTDPVTSGAIIILASARGPDSNRLYIFCPFSAGLLYSSPSFNSLRTYTLLLPSRLSSILDSARGASHSRYSHRSPLQFENFSLISLLLKISQRGLIVHNHFVKTFVG